MSLDSLCRWQVQVSVYCARRIPAHLRGTECSILLHLIDIRFLPCICLWKILQIQTCLCVVVGPGFVWTSYAFMRSSAVSMAGLPKKTVNWISPNLHSSLPKPSHIVLCCVDMLFRGIINMFCAIYYEYLDQL